MEEVHRARYEGKGTEFPCLLQVHPLSGTSTCSATWKFSKPQGSEILMETSSQGQNPSLTQSPASLPSLEDGGMRLKFPSF